MPIRKVSALLGVLGLVLMSGGLSLVVEGSAAAEANVVHKSYVCKYVGKAGKAERLQTGQNPIWVDNDSLPGFVKGALAYVGETFSDGQGRSVVIVANTPRLSPEPTVADCLGVVTPAIQFSDSSCVNGAASDPSWVGADTADITYTVTAGSVANGESVTITAMPKPNFAFFANADNVFAHTFGPVASNCGQVQPPPPPTPTLVTPGVSFVDSACANGSATDPSWVGTDTADIAYAVTGGSVANGQSVTITATPKPNFAFAANTDTVFAHTFGPAAANCGEVPPPPAPTPTLVSPGVSFLDSACGAGVATSPSWTGTNTADIDYAVTAGAVTDDSPVTITATPRSGFAFAPDTTATFSHTFGAAALNCAGASAIAVTSTAAQFKNPACPTDAGTVSLAGSGFMSRAQWRAHGDAYDTHQITYTIAGSFAPGGTVSVAAQADSGYALTPASKSQWAHTFKERSTCSTAAPVVVPDAVVIPTAIDAGLATSPTTVGATSTVTVWGYRLVGWGAALFVTAVLLRRRA